MLINAVAPFAGAWIEISERKRYRILTTVAPFAGAWIEMERMTLYAKRPAVAPFAGAWIEMPELIAKNLLGEGRSLRGSVD